MEKLRNWLVGVYDYLPYLARLDPGPNTKDPASCGIFCVRAASDIQTVNFWGPRGMFPINAR